jgi:hypothetical protein
MEQDPQPPLQDLPAGNANVVGDCEDFGVFSQTTLNHWGRPVEHGSALENYDNDWTTTQASSFSVQEQLAPFALGFFASGLCCHESISLGSSRPLDHQQQDTSPLMDIKSCTCNPEDCRNASAASMHAGRGIGSMLVPEVSDVHVTQQLMATNSVRCLWGVCSACHTLDVRHRLEELSFLLCL